jgi:ABC-type nitrate/sulfonate/bicarbonate transport system permease component
MATGEMNTALVFGVLVVLSALGILAFAAINILEKMICPWYLEQAEKGMQS